MTMMNDMVLSTKQINKKCFDVNASYQCKWKYTLTKGDQLMKNQSNSCIYLILTLQMSTILF